MFFVLYFVFWELNLTVLLTRMILLAVARPSTISAIDTTTGNVTKTVNRAIPSFSCWRA